MRRDKLRFDSILGVFLGASASRRLHFFFFSQVTSGFWFLLQ